MVWGNDIRQFNIFPGNTHRLVGGEDHLPLPVSMGISLTLLSFFAVFFKYARHRDLSCAPWPTTKPPPKHGISVKRVFALSWWHRRGGFRIGGILIGNIAGVGVD